MPDEPARKWRRRSGARPRELAQAAFALFSEQGFAATRLEDVAQRAGVSKATIYRYFENKEALFEAVVREAITPRFDEAELLLDAFEGSSSDMLRMLFNVLRAGIDGPFPHMIKLVLTESRNFPALANLWADMVITRGMQLVSRIIQRGIDRGEFRSVDSAATAPVVAAPFLLMALWKQTLSDTSFQLDQQRLIEAHIDLLLAGLAAKAAAGKPPSSKG